MTKATLEEKKEALTSLPILCLRIGKKEDTVWCSCKSVGTPSLRVKYDRTSTSGVFKNPKQTENSKFVSDLALRIVVNEP